MLPHVCLSHVPSFSRKCMVFQGTVVIRDDPDTGDEKAAPIIYFLRHQIQELHCVP